MSRAVPYEPMGDPADGLWVTFSPDHTAPRGLWARPMFELIDELMPGKPYRCLPADLADPEVTVR